MCIRGDAVFRDSLRGGGTWSPDQMKRPRTAPSPDDAWTSATSPMPNATSSPWSTRSTKKSRNGQRVLDALHASLVIQPQEDLAERVSPERAAKDLAKAGARARDAAREKEI
jgi:hypothetical protein